MTAGTTRANARPAASGQPQQHAGGDTLRGDLAVAARVGNLIAEMRDPPSGAEQAKAAEDLGFIQDCNWWTDATTPEITTAFEVACAWRDAGAWARYAIERIRAEVLVRYQVDALLPDASPAAVRAALAERARTEREAAALDLTDAAQAFTWADLQARHHRPGQASAHLERGARLYSSAERRQRLAQRIHPHSAPP